MRRAALTENDLRQCLRRLRPERYTEIRHFAASWFEAHGHTAEAVRHAVTLREILATGGESFYTGPLAARIVAHAEAGGALSAQDLER